MKSWSVYWQGHFVGVVDAPDEEFALVVAQEAWPGHDGEYAVLERGPAE